MDGFNPKSPLEYALGKFVEEGSEVIQAVEKIRTFGLTNRHRNEGINIAKLQSEISDWIGALQQVNLELGLFGHQPLIINDITAIRQKMIKIHKFSQQSRHLGLLSGPLRFPHRSSLYFFEPGDVPPTEFTPRLPDLPS